MKFYSMGPKPGIVEMKQDEKYRISIETIAVIRLITIYYGLI